MKTIYYKVPEYCGDETFEINVHKNFDLNNEIDAHSFARRAAQDFYENMGGEWRDDECLKFFLYETESNVYQAYVTLEIDPIFSCYGIKPTNYSQLGQDN